MAQSHLRRVRECRRALEAAREEFYRAIREAVSSGETYRDVGEVAGLSHQRIGQIAVDGRGAEDAV